MKTMIIGSGLSGLAVADFLSKHGEDYFFAKKEDIESNDFSVHYLLLFENSYFWSLLYFIYF